MDCNNCSAPCCTEGRLMLFNDEYKIFRHLNGDRDIPNYHFGKKLYEITLPCPFFDHKSNNCTIYDERPLVCHIFPLRITGVAMPSGMLGRDCVKFQDLTDQGISNREQAMELLDISMEELG